MMAEDTYENLLDDIFMERDDYEFRELDLAGEEIQRDPNVMDTFRARERAQQQSDYGMGVTRDRYQRLTTPEDRFRKHLLELFYDESFCKTFGVMEGHKKRIAAASMLIRWAATRSPRMFIIGCLLFDASRMRNVDARETRMQEIWTALIEGIDTSNRRRDIHAAALKYLHYWEFIVSPDLEAANKSQNPFARVSQRQLSH